jgi:uncharacterized protein YhaN
MFLRELKLTAFGHFSDRSLDLSWDGRLVIVFGRNETGKSTSLRGLEALLFGFEARSGDAHRHAKLQVGGTLVPAHGPSVELVRRSGKEPLRTLDGSLFEEERLRSLLRGVDRDLFRTLYGLDHVRLREGARALLDRKSSVAESLFDAGIAGAGVADELRSLRTAAESLFRPNSRATKKPPLNEAIRGWTEADKQSQRLATSFDFLTSQKEAIERATNERAELDDALRHLDRERRKLERLRRVATNVERRRRLFRELEALGTLPVVTDASRERRARIRVERAEAQETERLTAARIAALEVELEALGEQPSPRISRPERERLAALVQMHVKGGRRRAALEVAQERLQRECPSGAVEPPFDDREEQAILAVLEELAQLQSELARSSEVVSSAEAELDTLGASTDFRAIERDLLELEAATEAVEIAERRATAAQSELQAAELLVAESRAIARSLGIAGEVMDDVMNRQVPAWEWLQDLEGREARAMASIASVEADVHELEREVARAMADERALLAGGPILGDEDLLRSRAARDELIATGAPRANVERAVIESDAIADRLRHDGDRRATASSLRQRRAEHEADLSRARARLRDAEEALRGTADLIAAGLAPLGAPRLGARAAADWLRRFGEANRAQERASVMLREVERAGRALMVATEHLERTSARFAERSAASLEEPRAVRRASAARPLLESVRRELESARQREARRVELTRARDATRRDATRLEQRLRGAEARLRDSATAFGLPEPATPASVVKLNAERRRDRERLDELERVRTELAEKDAEDAELLATLSSSLGTPYTVVPSNPELHAALAELDRREAVQSRSDELRRELGDERVRRERASRALLAAEAELADDRAALGAPTEVALEELDQRVARARDLERTIATLDEQLVLAAETTELAALEQELGSRSTEDLELEMEAQDAERSDLERKKERLIHQKRSLEEAIVRVEKEDSQAAAYAEQAAQYRARAKALTLQYVRQRLAAFILEREIDTYQRLHQGPVLTRAAEHFRRLTLGSFDALKVVIDAKNQPELVCLRADKEIGVDALSDGAKDQLFLALRLATIERHGEGFEPLPLVLDDVLIHFDEERTRSALEVFASLAGSMQVLLFTHLARNVELAEEALGNAVRVVHL